MKPITFEVIRNLLKTKKKCKEKGIDQSFKRSDSFKRISIRKSYLDRGRRRGVLRSKTVLDLNDIEIKSTSSSLERRNKNHDDSPDECSSQEPSIIAELERKDASIDEKIRALQEINDRYMRENQKTKYVEKKTAIPKPPRNSKLKERNECVSSKKISKPSTIEKSKENICDKTESKDLKGPKTVSQINILFTGETNENSLDKPLVDKRHSSKLLEDDQSSYYSVSTFTLDSQAYQNTSSTRHSNYSRSVSYPHGVDHGKDQDNSSFLTFTTYCQSNKSDTNKKYLETSFDEPDMNTSRSNTESGTKFLNKNVKNISTTSLVYEPTYVKPVINTQTFKMVKSKAREAVIIRIPAVENGTQQNGDDDNDKDRLNRQSSNDSAVEADSNSSVEKLNQIQEKSTINATITYEKICKAFDRQEAKYKKNPKKDKRKDLRRERLESHLSTQKPLSSSMKDKQDVLSDEGLIASTESLEISSPKNGTFDLKSPRNSMQDLQSINYMGTYDKATSDKFIFPKDYFEEENNISYRVDNDGESPEGIAIALKIKENPFTKHKEISAVNTSRIWKQVNLGQEDEIISTNPLPIPPPLKPKNESFKSMSSHDSGFSLTLTKPKNLFRRKSKKQRRKPKLSVSRDGYFKRVMVVQHNSTKRKKNNKKQRPQGKDVFKALYDDNWTKLGGNYTSTDQMLLSGNEYENQSILRDFENFCNRNKHFNKEINDLEEFYEEHLKRLKHYYLQRKQMNEVAIREFYRDYANDEEFYDAHIVSRNDTFRFKSKRVGRPESPEYLFPYPDKRIALGKKRSKMQFPEVRTFKSHILGNKYSDSNISNTKKESLDNLKSNKDFNQFPYWKLSRKVSKRERVAPKFKDRFIDPFETEKNEVSLADIFPSVNDTLNETNNKNLKNESDSDEFSEQEFIANCLGDDLYCSTCDKNNSDCECYTDEEAERLAKTSNSKMKSLKRRRSKKRLRKNHSTLRRDYFYGKQFILSLFILFFYIQIYQ